MSGASGVRLDLPEAEYHAHPAFSQSAAKTLLESPARYRWQLTNPSTPTRAFDVGHAVHAEVLGVGLPVVEIPTALLAANGAISTKAAKEWVTEARARGDVPLVADTIATIQAMTAAVLANSAARAAFEAEGSVEASMS